MIAVVQGVVLSREPPATAGPDRRVAGVHALNRDVDPLRRLPAAP
jgi:hypothetical protein